MDLLKQQLEKFYKEFPYGLWSDADSLAANYTDKVKSFLTSSIELAYKAGVASQASLRSSENANCKRIGHAWKCLRCEIFRDGVNPNDFWKDLIPNALSDDPKGRNDARNQSND
jgi:hypothetical protein